MQGCNCSHDFDSYSHLQSSTWPHIMSCLLEFSYCLPDVSKWHLSNSTFIIQRYEELSYCHQPRVCMFFSFKLKLKFWIEMCTSTTWFGTYDIWIKCAVFGVVWLVDILLTFCRHGIMSVALPKDRTGSPDTLHH